jgi:ectoine hydroxylase-related dioxygenase (phytanoyl-CoA dioxygenase family)
MSLNEERIQEFREKGFIVVKGMFDGEAMANISAWADELQAKDPEPGAEAKYYEQSVLTGDDVLVRIENVVGDEINPEMTRLLISPEVTAVLTELLGEAPVLFKEKINYKLPGCRADKLHQDQAAGWNKYTDFFITLAIAIDANREDNAALSFMSSGNYPHADLMTEEWKPITEVDPPYEPAEEYTLIEADPGDVIFFDSYVPHGSPPNTSDRPRRNIFLTFNRESAGDLRARYYADKWASYAPNKAGQGRGAAEFRV